MFLMNTSPLVALPRKWEPFPQSRNCRYPVCFSESEEDLARTAVNAKVQMIISNLQSEEVALGTSSKYGCVVQKKQKAAKDRGHKFGRNNQLLQEHINYTLRSYPTDSDGMDMEESTEFGPLALNSDSDDSVDRDIEEAIQEHLRNKVQNLPPIPNNTKNLPSEDGDNPVQQKFPSRDAICCLFPAGCGPVSLAQPYVVPGRLEDNAVQWASSPCSVSSDDSFEQSIKAEIEQFLKKKKQQARKKVPRRNRPCHRKEELQEKLALAPKGSMNNQSSLKQGGKACFSKRHPELQSIGAATSLKPKTSETERQTGSSVRDSSFLEESPKSRKRQIFCHARRDLSDSSSDDGIEEAIQRYQLEKMKKAAEPRAGHVSLQRKESFGANKTEKISPSPRSALPEITPKAQRCKRKDASGKAAAVNRPCNRLGKSKSFSPPGSSFTKCAVTFQASCRADTAAELMCAEAILDISKTVLPLPTASGDQLFSTGPPFSSQNVLTSQYESDSNIVDSDDSIEQEIRAFLAVKARTKHLIAKSTFQVPLSLGQPRQRAQGSKRTPPKGLKLPLNHKKTFKRKCEIIPQNEDAQLNSEVGYFPKSSVSQLKNERAGQMVIYPKDIKTPIHSISIPCSLSHPEPHDSGSPVESVTQSLQRCGADDKSSSFDSDEDLDTAIKDLLSSKRKLKKRPKDQRVHGKKKDPLGDAEMPILYKGERDSHSQTPTLLKKCLVHSRKDIREGNVKKGPLLRKPKSTIDFEPECKKESQTKPVSGAEIQQATKTGPCLWAVTSLMDESSSVDSDDSIEEEIQRFLAEKAKSTIRTGGLQDAPGVAGTLGADKPQAALLKAEWRPLGQGSPAPEKEDQKLGRVDPPGSEVSSRRRCAGESDGNASRPSERARPFTGDGISPAPVENPPAEDTEEMELPIIRRAVIQRKDIWEERTDQRSLSPGMGKAEERCKWQGCFKATPSLQRKRSHEIKMPSKCLAAGLRDSETEKKSELLGKRQQAFCFQDAGTKLAANLFGEGSPPKEMVGCRSEAGVREADPKSQAGSLPSCRQTRDGSTQEMTLTTEVVNLARCNHVESHNGDASQNLPLPGSGIEETTISPGVPYVEVPVSRGKLLEYSPSWAKGEVPEGPCDLSLKGKAISQADEQVQKLLEGGPAESGQWGNVPTAS